MSNYCSNGLRILGDPKELKLFKERHCDNFNFNTIIPEPKIKEECPIECIVTDGESAYIEEDETRPWFDWYHWHLHYWGTKWNSFDVITHCLDDSIVISFTTAWTPAIPIIEKLMEMYPGLIFDYEYYEPGNMIAGICNRDSNYEWVTFHDQIELDYIATEYEFEDPAYIVRRDYIDYLENKESLNDFERAVKERGI